jgi:hypothetical protein
MWRADHFEEQMEMEPSMLSAMRMLIIGRASMEIMTPLPPMEQMELV